MPPKKRKTAGDLFKCGGCQRNYHELDEFIAHKKECDAEQDAEESENTAEEADQSPKEPPKKRGRPSKAELAERERRREEERREAEALGGCNKCDGCTRQEDCGRCVPCQSRQGRISSASASSSLTSASNTAGAKVATFAGGGGGSSENEMCIMRKCEMLTDDSDVFKAIGDLSLPAIGEDGGSSRPRKQRQSKAACTDFLKRLSGSIRSGPVIPAGSAAITITSPATISAGAKEASHQDKEVSETPGTTSKRVVPSILQRKKRPVAASSNTTPVAAIVSPSTTSASSNVTTLTKGSAAQVSAGVQGAKFITTGPVAGISPSAFSAVVESGQQVLIVNSDQLSLLQNSQGIVVMQSADPKTLQVEVVRLNEENGAAGSLRAVGQKAIKRETVEEVAPTAGAGASTESENAEDEEYDPTRVRAHIIRGPAAFARKRVVPVPPQPPLNKSASAFEFLTPEQRRLLVCKKSRSKLMSAPRQRKSRLFVVADDGVTIEITGAALSDRNKAVERADEKMPYVREKMAIMQNQAQGNAAGHGQNGPHAASGVSTHIQMNTVLSHQQPQLMDTDEDVQQSQIQTAKQLAAHALKKDPLVHLGALKQKAQAAPASAGASATISLEDCTADFADMNSMQKLPNQVQLVESDLPLSEAENVEGLFGNYLFRQMHSSQDQLRCLFCRDKFTFKFLVDLEKHYHVIHEVQTIATKAEFSDSAVFICLPDDVTEETLLKSACQFCNATLRTLAEVRDHYTQMHERSIRHVYEGQLANLSSSFYCGACNFASPTFEVHHEHMKAAHLRMTFVCKYCNYCTPRPGRLKAHVKQRHLDGQPGPHLQCTVCSVYVHGRERLTKHVLLSHAVQTGPAIWSCAKCLEPTSSHDELLAHIAKCPDLVQRKTSEPIKRPSGPEAGATSFKCFHCEQTFTDKEEVERHILEDKCSPEFGDHDAEGLDESATTCFLCNVTFKNAELTAQHLHHVHMKWVKRTVRSADQMPEVTSQVCPLNDATEIIMDPSAMLDRNEVPSEARLNQMGFPSKVGHYCHLCDVVIKNYTLFYLHMHNLHGMQKRFICVVTSCSNTFEESAAFQVHVRLHNQRGEHFCAMCDMIFDSGEDLQEHFVSPQHATQHMRVQDKHNRSEPRNYRCRVCHTWHGLLSTFVRHMETESHQYQCQHCGQLFVQPAPRRNHIQNAHPEMANICEICGAKATSAQALWSHLSQHSVVHECAKCHRRFLQKEQLMAHMEIHAPPTPCPWEGCNRRLSTKVGLYNHLRLHRGECDFKCQICDRGFFKKKSLDIHLKSHENAAAGTPVGGVSLLGSRGGLLKPRPGGSAGAPEVRLICSGCLKGFDSEAEFGTHDCNSTAGQGPEQIFVDANGQPILPLPSGHHGANGEDNMYLSEGGIALLNASGQEGVVSIRKDLNRGVAIMTLQEAGTLFSLEVEGGREGIHEIDENIAVQLLRAAAGDDVTHLQVEDKGRTTQYKILKYHEQQIEDDGEATAMGAEADESEGHVATMESGVEGEPLVGKPNEDVHHHLVEQTADTCEKIVMSDVTEAHGAIEASAVAGTQLEDSGATMMEQLGTVAEPGGVSKDRTQTEMILEEPEDGTQDASQGQQQHQDVTDAGGVGGGQTMVVMINEQAYHIAIPEGVDPQSFASSTLVKVNQEDGTERVLLVPVRPDGDLRIDAGIAIDGSLLDS